MNKCFVKELQHACFARNTTVFPRSSTFARKAGGGGGPGDGRFMGETERPKRQIKSE